MYIDFKTWMLMYTEIKWISLSDLYNVLLFHISFSKFSTMNVNFF